MHSNKLLWVKDGVEALPRIGMFWLLVNRAP
jgi:hypothetical protein